MTRPETSWDREALAAHHQDRVDLHAAQPTSLTVYIQYEPAGEPWYAVVTDSDTGRKLGGFHGPSAHDIMREVALCADKATVQR